jgi:hypothetical protein
MNAKPEHRRVTMGVPALPAEPRLAGADEKLLANQDCAAMVLGLGWWQRFSIRVQAWFEIPFGYQNESGFHYDRPPKWDRDHQAGAVASVVPVGRKN